MDYGICTGPDKGSALAAGGFDFFEWSVSGLLQPREDEEAFRTALREVQRQPLPCPVVNCFVPGDLKITGETADPTGLAEYTEICMRRAAEADVEVIVFGSGKARAIPQDCDRQAAWRQLVEFSRTAARTAEEYGVTIAVEPLNSRECNVLTTVGEAAKLVREVDHPALRLLVDSYHWALENDSEDDIRANGQLLAHVHVATAPDRLPPGLAPFDFGRFMRALEEAGYDGRISVEARTFPQPEDMAKVRAALERAQ